MRLLTDTRDGPGQNVIWEMWIERRSRNIKNNNNKWLLGVSLGLLVGAAPVWGNPFPAGYATATEYSGHWYALTLDYGTWQESEDEAVLIGGHLVRIDDAGENEWVMKFIQDSYCRNHTAPAYNIAWIGLSHVGGVKDNAASWEWTDGETPSFWNPDDRGISGGTHMYMMGFNHVPSWGGPTRGEWGCNDVHDTDTDLNPRGIIEIPEPATLSLLVLGGLAVLNRKRK